MRRHTLQVIATAIPPVLLGGLHPSEEFDVPLLTGGFEELGLQLLHGLRFDHGVLKVDVEVPVLVDLHLVLLATDLSEEFHHGVTSRMCLFMSSFFFLLMRRLPGSTIFASTISSGDCASAVAT